MLRSSSPLLLCAVSQSGLLARPALLPRPVLLPLRSLLPQRRHRATMQFGGSGDDSPAPTDKQMAYAQRLALESGMQMPEDAALSSRSCSAFIDSCLQNLPPSEKQLQYAMSIAEQQGVPLPPEAATSRASCSSFIEQNKGAPLDGGFGQQQPGGGGGWAEAEDPSLPSEKQLK